MTMATEIKSRMSSVSSGAGGGANKPAGGVNINAQGKPVQNSSGGCC